MDRRAQAGALAAGVAQKVQMSRRSSMAIPLRGLGEGNAVVVEVGVVDILNRILAIRFYGEVI